MSGSYGIIRGADFNPAQDAEVWLSYKENRSSIGTGFTKVDVTKYLTSETNQNNPIGGLYQLKLPLDVFNRIGIYNIFIRPKEIVATIQDVGVLLAYPEIRGIILTSTELTQNQLSTENDSLVGYRVEYYNTENEKVPNLFRIITSNNRCEPANQNITNANQKSVSYRFNDNSNLMFLTLTPSSSSNTKPNTFPYIGNSQTKIVLTNTFFNSELIEIEMTKNDIESLYNSINGDKITTLDNGLTTIYDENGNIVEQVEHYTIKESATGTPVYEVRTKKTDIDFSQDYNTIVGNV